MPDAKKLLGAKDDLDREYAEQQQLLRHYGNNRAGRRKAAAEMKKRKKAPDGPQNARKRKRKGR